MGSVGDRTVQHIRTNAAWIANLIHAARLDNLAEEYIRVAIFLILRIQATTTCLRK